MRRACVLLLGLLLGCPSSAPRSRPDILLVTFDTLRADHCSIYGYPRATTPTLERLAEEGIVLESAYAPTPTTQPSHSTLFTSLDPDEHGVRKNGELLAEPLVTMAEVLREEGYQTAAFVSSHVLKAKFGLSQGFEVYSDDLGEAPERNARATTESALSWLSRREKGRPLFMWVHYFEPHDAYTPPLEHVAALQREPSAVLDEETLLYDAEIRFADAELGRLHAALERTAGSDGLLSIVTADHGQGLGQHGWCCHGIHLYEEAVRVPFLVRWPDRVPAGARIEGLFGLIDVLPSLLGLLGMSQVGLAARGRDCAPIWTQQRADFERKTLFFQRRVYDKSAVRDGEIEIPVDGPMWAVREGRWKLIVSPSERGSELYDLEGDPHETVNVARENGDVVERLERSISSWRESQTPRSSESAASEEDIAVLRALGYVE